LLLWPGGGDIGGGGLFRFPRLFSFFFFFFCFNVFTHVDLLFHLTQGMKYSGHGYQMGPAGARTKPIISSSA
jgi:hypothetical protein